MRFTLGWIVCLSWFPWTGEFTSHAEPIDIENAPTPIRLPSLLPDEGIEGVAIDAWTKTTTYRNGVKSGSAEAFRHWLVGKWDERIVVETTLAYAGNSGMRVTQRFTYSLPGELESYREIRIHRGELRTDMIGRIEGDEMVIKVNPDAKEKHPELKLQLNRERRIPVKVFATHVPLAWMPLVRAYHIKNGHLGYVYKTIDLTRNAEKITHSFEDVGSERLAWEDGEVVGHLLLGSSENEMPNRSSTSQVQMMVTLDGVTFRSDSTREEWRFLTERISAEQAIERLGMKPNRR
jgi:hypothetical protein